MSPAFLNLFALFLLSPWAVRAQVGTMPQDLSTIAAYSQQLPCAQSCFMYGKSCPRDILGQELGCNSNSGCSSRGWEAKNDCYCRPDLQTPAQQWLTSCISSACSVGNAALDASSAGAIYNQYCQGKGYTAGPLPATVQATITAADGSLHTSAKVFNPGPTGSTTGSGSSSGTSSSSSKSSSLSLTTIIGIVVGSLAGLAFLGVAIKAFMNFCGPCLKRKPAQPQNQLPIADNKGAVYPMQPYYQEGYYPSPRMDDELKPDDSLSVVGGFARPAPTLVSDGGPARRW
jgi:hypothetical protein